MRTVMSTLLRVAAIGMVTAGLAACGDNTKTPAMPVVVVPPAPPPPAPKLEDQFGANFGNAFRANPNTDAGDPAAGDIVPVSATADPVAI